MSPFLHGEDGKENCQSWRTLPTSPFCLYGSYDPFAVTIAVTLKQASARNALFPWFLNKEYQFESCCPHRNLKGRIALMRPFFIFGP